MTDLSPSFDVASPNDPIVAIVLADGEPVDAVETAYDARRCSRRVRIICDGAAAASIRELLGGTHGMDVVTHDWRAEDTDPTVLAGIPRGWALVLAAGDRVLPQAMTALLAALRHDPPTARGVTLVGGGRPLRLLPVGAEHLPASQPHLESGAGRHDRGRNLDGAPADRPDPCPEPTRPEPTCPVCGASAGFDRLPDCFVTAPADAGFTHPVDGWELLDVDRYSCRSCGASDRDRLIWLYLDAHLSAGPGTTRLLEIAPSPVLGPRLRRMLGAGYRSGDLFMAGVDDRVDLEAMHYADHSFDWLLCSHVLEHVTDDIRAMREIRRVLRPGGRALLLVPISTVAAATDHDPSLRDPAARLARFGQDDHVRLYTRDGFVSRLTQAGLTVEIVGVGAVAPHAAARHAIPSTGALYVVRP